MDIYDSKDFSCSSNKFVRDCLVFDWEKDHHLHNFSIMVGLKNYCDIFLLVIVIY